MSYTHLQVHSGYSLMNSTIQIPQLVEKAKSLGFTSLALTDEYILSGSIAFYQECKAFGIKPIIGLKLNVSYRNELFPVTILAKNKIGYQVLLQLSTKGQINENGIELKDFKDSADELVAIVTVSDTSWADALSHHSPGRMDEEVKEWKEMFKDFYLGVKDYGIHLERQIHSPLKEWSVQHQIPVTNMNQVRYLEKEDSEAYYCLRAIALNAPGERENKESHQYLKSPEEMETYFKDWWPEVLESNKAIVDSCEVELEFNQTLLPSYPVPKGKSADDYLRSICDEKLSTTYSPNNEKAQQRLERELDVITSMNFSDYFLIVWDFIDYAKKNNIAAGPGRGSAAGSIVSYLLGITQVDPLAYDLLFERFLNPERITMPDIDIDFPDDRRDEVIDYVAKKYGKEHVAQICTFGTFATRSVLRELFKVFEIDESDAAFILKQLSSGTSQSLKSAVQQSDALKQYIRSSPLLIKLFRVASKLEGLPRHVSTHAAGVVISENPLVNHTALMRGQAEVPLTQLAMGDLENIGLLKMDFLGLRNLSLLRKMEAKIKSYKSPDFQYSSIKLDDEKTFELLQKGRTNGVFQLESQGMKSVLQRLKPTHFEDVVAVNALYRPGPMEYIPVYIKRKHNIEKVSYPHPMLKPILEKTFGVLVYQEQIMQVAQKVAGYSLGEADLLRRAVSKKQRNVLEQQQDQFVKSSKQNGFDQAVAVQLFEWIVKFSNYGFNRSHAVAYSYISYQLAYIKAHFPSIFMSELINATIGDKDKLASYVKEARDLKLKVKAPSINSSYPYALDEQGSIRLGFLSIKGIGYPAAQAIVEERKKSKFKSLYDFCLRLQAKDINRSVLEALIMGGAFDEVQQNRAGLLASIDQALEQGELFREFQDVPDLFYEDGSIDGQLVPVEPFPILKELALEKETLGIYLSKHPLETHRNSLAAEGYKTLLECAKLSNKSSVQAAAVIDEIKEIRTKRGDPMAFLTISDETEEMEAVLFPAIYREVKQRLEQNQLVLINGKMEERNNKKQLIINETSKFHNQRFTESEGKRLFIKTTTKEEARLLERLRKVASYFPGNTTVIVFVEEERKTYQLDSSYFLNPTKSCMQKLYDFFGEESVVLKDNNKKI
ncbi:DNA polymerase III subunit alpha [Halobacillus sp. A5]|uniref:DNA polymerase III subunit alpha n=1 Tax=Halobacillus sp. A5 TaxID=2880263 RepID=UPI0020A69EDA|nr:DNA polymerase III subunit alpha [Halobacillus sp. A5]MCP3025451.1 DNA polymerase III subunit alpha [Halobacillus sp. A5]